MKTAYRGDGSPIRTPQNDLDCPMCESWFASFGDLAAHVKAHHSTTPPTQEKRTMAKRQTAPRSTRATSTRANTNARVNGKVPHAEGPRMNAFLKADNIGKGKIGTKGTVILTGNMRVVPSQFGGDQIVCEARVNGHVFDWGIKVNSPNHRILEDRLGKAYDNVAKWKGVKLPVTIIESMGKPFVAIDRDNK